MAVQTGEIIESKDWDDLATKLKEAYAHADGSDFDDSGFKVDDPIVAEKISLLQQAMMNYSAAAQGNCCQDNCCQSQCRKKYTDCIVDCNCYQDCMKNCRVWGKYRSSQLSLYVGGCNSTYGHREVECKWLDCMRNCPQDCDCRVVF